MKLRPGTGLLIFALPFITLSFPVTAQDHDHEDDADHHVHHTWEIGGAVGAVYNIQEKHTAPGIHAHILKNFGEENQFGVGLGFETFLDEHQHLNFGIPLNYNTLKKFVFTVTPGVLLKNETTWESNPSIHFETLYEFEFEHFHMGPMLELAFAPGDFHIMLGLHVGLGWK
jgi:hypothetical protein